MNVIHLLPPCLLLILAGYHAWLVHTQHLSRWLGGGFGMFSTTDEGTARQVRLIAVHGTERWPLELPDHLYELMQRFRGLPNQQWSIRLAGAMLDYAQSEGCRESSESCHFDAIVIELWLTDYQPETLMPAERQLLQYRHETISLAAR